MTEELRDLLQRVVDDVPPARVPDDTWARARRARRRERLAGALAVAAVVLGVVGLGLGAGVTSPGLVAPADRLPGPGRPLAGAGAVPTVIRAVPADQDHRDEAGRPAGPRLGLGDLERASAAYTTISGNVVLVDARTGEHRLVRLPGFNDRFAGIEESAMVAVSPDGTQLAYSWRDPVRPLEGARWETGVAVATLGDPHPDVQRLPYGVGVRATHISWSPDGRYVLFTVSVLTSMSENGFTSSGARLERLDVGTGELVTVPRLGRFASPSAVADDGTVAVAPGDEIFTWPAASGRAGGDGVERWPLGGMQLSTRPAWSGDGRLAVASGHEGGLGLLVARPAERRARTVAEGADGVLVPLGWVGRDHLVAVQHDVPSWDENRLVVVPVRGGPVRTVGQVEVDVTLQLGTLTLATELMSPQRPTVEFEAPAWARTSSRWWVAGGLALVTVGAVALVAVRRRA